MDLKSEKTVLIAGASGFIGARIKRYLESEGYRVRGLGRASGNATDYAWDPDTGQIDPKALDGVDIVVNLAGESIAEGRWTAARMRRILESRIKGTRLLVDSMKKATVPPAVFLCASGVNFYGSSGREMDENSPRGDGFLAEVCEKWEAEAMRATDFGVRTVCLRFGVVLHPKGGALAKMLPIFRLGLGGRIGTGKQGFPWIAMDDLLRIIGFCAETTTMRGPVNAVHPKGLTQAEFAGELAKSLSRRIGPPLPKIMVKILFGRMGEETLLVNLRVYPRLLLTEGFRFSFANVSEALSSMFK